VLSLSEPLKLERPSAFLHLVSTLIAPIVAICLIFAQFLPSFATVLKSWLKRHNIYGEFREELVRLCIINGAKIRR
jgi:hypothetical protein